MSVTEYRSTRRLNSEYNRNYIFRNINFIFLSALWSRKKFLVLNFSVKAFVRFTRKDYCESIRMIDYFICII